MDDKITFFTPGPSKIYPGTEKYLKEAFDQSIPSISHRSKEYVRIHTETVERLRNLLNIPGEYSVFFLNSATECWERLCQNCISEEGSFLVNGAFSRRFAQTAEAYKRKTDVVMKSSGSGFTSCPELSHSSECIAYAVNETSTGVYTSPEIIRELRQKYPDKLIFADGTSAFPHYQPAFESVDAAYFSVQKGMGMPAGLSVLIVSPRCIEKSDRMKKEGKSTGFHHSFQKLLINAEKSQTPCTPNVLGIFLLNNILKDMLQRGIDKIRKEGEEKSEMIYAELKNFGLQPFVKEEELRSETICVFSVSESGRLLEQLKTNHRVLPGNGYGEFKGKQIRIANFPSHTEREVMYLIKAIKSELNQ